MLAEIVSAEWSRPQYLARIGQVIRRYVLMRRVLEETDVKRSTAMLLLGHPGALREQAAIAAAEAARRLAVAERTLDQLRGGAPLPMPHDRDAARTLAVGDLQWIALELRALRRMGDHYGVAARVDPLPLQSQQLAAARAMKPHERLGHVIAIVAVRHQLENLRGYLMGMDGSDDGVKRVRVARSEEVSGDGGICVEAFDRKIAIFRDGDRVCAIEDTCPHRGGPLHQGKLDAGGVTCPLHAWTFELSTGEMRNNPNLKIVTFEVVEEDGELFVLGPTDT